MSFLIQAANGFCFGAGLIAVVAISKHLFGAGFCG